MGNTVQFIEARMQAESRAAILASTDWLSAAEVTHLAHNVDKGFSARLAQWLQARKIFAITVNGQSRFPAYGFDPSNEYQPNLILVDVIAILEIKRDGWGIASWFAGVNSYLGARRPLDVIAREPERVVAAARHDIERVLHG